MFLELSSLWEAGFRLRAAAAEALRGQASMTAVVMARQPGFEAPEIRKKTTLSPEQAAKLFFKNALPVDRHNCVAASRREIEAPPMMCDK